MTMSKFRLVVSSIILSSASALAVAHTADAHNPHHPNMNAARAQAYGASAWRQSTLATHTQPLTAVHEKLQKARPQERQAMMSEHHELMQEGMKMMGMASAGMQGMGMMGNMHSQTTEDQSDAPSAAHHTMMLKRMDMMQSMMQMMMDRMPAPHSPNQ